MMISFNAIVLSFLFRKMTARSPRRTKNSSVSSSCIHQQKYGSSEQQGCHGKSILALQGRKSPRVASQQMALTPSRHAGLDEVSIHCI